MRLAAALVERSRGKHGESFPGWGDVVIFAACTGARIGEVSGLPRWRHRPQLVDLDGAQADPPSPGGLVDKGTKGKRARVARKRK